MGVRNCNDSSACRWLQEIGALPDNLNLLPMLAERGRTVIEPTKRLAKMWQQASRQGRSIVDPQSQRLFAELSLVSDPSMSWACEGTGQLVGFLESDQLEDFLRPRRQTSPKRHRPRPRQIVPADTASVLTVPFYDVPGRICSLGMIYAGGGGGETWRAAMYSPSLGKSSDHWEEGGIAAHPRAVDADDQGRVLATTNLEVYLRMTCKHFAANSQALPLVCYRDQDRVTNDWQLLANKKLTLWSPTLTPQVLWRAIRLGATIYTAGNSVLTARELLYRKEPAAIVNRCFHRAKSWVEAVIDVVQSKNHDELADWLCKLELGPPERKLILAKCNSVQQEKFNRAVGSPTAGRTIAADGGWVEQRASGWYFVKPNESEYLITDAPFRITQAISSDEPGAKVMYHVEANYQGKRFRFVETAKEMNLRAFETVESQAILAGVGLPSHHPKWRRSAMYCAKQFYETTAVKALRKIGFDPATQCFELPGVSIDTVTGRWRTVHTGADHLPGAKLPIHSRMTEVAELLKQKASQPLLAVLTAVTCQLLCDVVGRSQPGISLSGHTAKAAAKQVAATLDMQDLEKGYQRVSEKPLGSWPVIDSDDAAGTRLRRKLLNSRDVPVIHSVSREQRVYSLLTSDHILVQSRQISLDPSLDLAPLGRLTIELLAYACQEKLQHPFSETPDTLAATQEIVQKFLRHNRLPRENWKYAEHWLRQRTDTGEQLVTATAEMVVLGHLRLDKFVPRRGNAVATIYCCEDTDEVYVPVRVLRDIFSQHGCPRFDISEMLLGIICGKTPAYFRSHAGQQCWVIKKSSLDSQIRSRRQLAPQRLKIVG